MIRYHNIHLSIMVLYAVALHMVWAVILVNDASATNATAVHAVSRFIKDPETLAAVIFSAAAFALIGLFSYRVPLFVMLLLPQQVLLVISAAGAIEAMWLSQFADGVVRPRGFIAADQIYSVLAAAGHTIAIIAHAVNHVGDGR